MKEHSLLLSRILQEVLDPNDTTHNTTAGTATSIVGDDPLEPEEYDDRVSTLLFFLFGLLIVCTVCNLAHMNRTNRQQQEETTERRQQEEEMEKQKGALKRRRALIHIIQNHQLMQKLGATHFQVTDPANAEMQVKEGLLVLDENNSVEQKPRRSIDADEEEGETTIEARRDAETSDSGALDLELGEAVPKSPVQDDGHDAAADTQTTENAVVSAEKKEQQQMMMGRESIVQGEIVLPRQHKSCAVPNLCAICLDSYQTGDTVVWSGNSDCQHVFHQECILDYLVQHKEEKQAPCPICRQVFLSVHGWKRPAESA